MLKFVIWGAGRRGERAIRLIGSNRVVAVIDMDCKKVGQSLHGVNIISFEQYEKQFKDCFIILTMFYDENVVKSLNEKNIYNYLSFHEVPSEFISDKSFSLYDLPIYKYKKTDNIGIYGVNLFSLLLYEFMKKNNYTNIYIINDKERITGNLSIFSSEYRFSNDCTMLDRILVTNKDFHIAALKYRNVKIDDFWDFSYQLKQYENHNLYKFKDIHKGNRLFLVATGPSLTFADLECLNKNNELCMSVNMIYKGFSSTKWRPNYYVMADKYGLDEYGEELKSLDLPVMFIADSSTKFWNCANNYNNIYQYHMIIDRMFGWPQVSDDIVKGVYDRGTVISDCLQIAIYMGFSEIYLLGTDCNYKGSTQQKDNHFIKEYFNENDKQPATIFPLEDSFSAYQAIRHYAEQHNTKIYNATRGGKLEVFERVDFDSLFNTCIR